MNIKRKYKDEILNELTPEVELDDIKAHLSFKEKKELGYGLFMNKKLVYGLSVAGVLILAGGTTAGIMLTRGSRSAYKSAGEDSVVRMEVNPSISFSVDKKNIVTAVSGDNNEGKMVLLEEKIKGLPLEQAIEKVIEIENELGYIVSGTIEKDENNIKFTINVDDAKAKELLTDLVNNTVEKVSEKLDLDTKIQMLDTLTKEQMIKFIKELDPSYSAEDLEKKSYAELIDIMDSIMLERENYYSNEIADLYAQMKQYEFNVAEQEWTKNVISEIGGIYGVVYNAAIAGIDLAVSGMNAAIDVINDLRYNLFVAEDSAYQTVFGTFLDAKSEVLEIKNNAANIEDEEARNEVLALLDKGVETLTSIENSLAETKESALERIDSGVEAINSAIDKVHGIIDELPGQEIIEKTLSDRAGELDEYLNKTKDELVNEFEKEYKDDLTKAKDRFVEYRHGLKEKIKAARS